MPSSMSFVIMARDIVKNLKFKKYEGKFNVAEFAQMLDDAYMATKRPDGDMTKKSFSPSSLGYGNGNCPRYWYMAFSGAHFVDNNDATAVANMAYGTQAHERLQKLIAGQSSDLFKTNSMKSVQTEIEITNEYPPIRGFIDLVINWDDEEVIGEIKTAKQEVWDTRQAEMNPSANHMLQLLTYMKLRNAKEAFFLYENKNTQEILLIPIQMTAKNKKIIDELFIWMCEVWDNFKEGDLPMRPFLKTSYACKGCPIKKECWAGETGTIQIEAYEVPKL
ncbi:MAG: Dna2/Cas4 domain-containing protein [Actinobacteria bacterium]|nr:Dna2/Cas4 domain-containing protein [Actinomycetota bacterium]